MTVRCRRCVRIAVLLVAAGCPAAAARAQPVAVPDAPILAQAIRNGWVFFRLESGRMVLSGGNAGIINVNPGARPGVDAPPERLSIGTDGAGPSMSYERTNDTEKVSIDARGDGWLRVARTARGESQAPPVEFVQEPGRPLRLTVGDQGSRQVYEAAGMWHLLLTHPEVCRRQLVPLLDPLQPAWNLAETADAVERDLLRAAAAPLPDTARWIALVRQLDDERFAVREAADRQLRAAGLEVVGFLRQIDPARLSAEQRFRVRRIIEGILVGGLPDEAIPAAQARSEQIAWSLVWDWTIWLPMLGRSDSRVRELAARRLSAILGEPVPVDVAADPQTQQNAIRRLRQRLERSGAAALQP